jgi:hypothetical protein
VIEVFPHTARNFVFQPQRATAGEDTGSVHSDFSPQSGEELPESDDWIPHRRITPAEFRELAKRPVVPIPIEMESQSGREVNYMPSALRVKEQNEIFRDGENSSTVMVPGGPAPTSYIAATDDVSLQNFLSRPVNVITVPWAQGLAFSAFGVEFDLWDLFMTNPRVANKVTGYAQIRGRIHCKLTINGGPFYFGRMLAALHPHHRSDDLAPFDGTVDVQSLCPLSQLPHVYLDPTTSQGGEISMPFLNGTEYFACGYDSTDYATGYGDTVTLVLRQLATLRHANNSSIGLNIKVYVWLTEVEYSTLTSQSPSTLVAQSGEEAKGSSSGFISGPATIVAAASKKLSDVPVIGPYAQATHEVARAVGSVAKAFGFSRPTNTATTRTMESAGNFVNADVPDMGFKLTLDSVQELSIDPKTIGFGVSEDPFAIANIASRESWMDATSWDTSSPPGTVIKTWVVQPFFRCTSALGGFYLPAVGAASLPYGFWGGTLRYRFMIVCCSHHQGRLRVSWDPDMQGFGASGEHNINHTMIIDIAKTRDFTVEIGWGQRTPYVPRYTTVDNVSEQAKGTNINFSYKPWGNGTLRLEVLNELTIPATDADASNVEIHVFVSGGDDFRVANPISEMLDLTYRPQSGLEETEVIKPNQEDESSETLGSSSQVLPQIDKVYFGESFVSWRPLLKRYMIYRRIPTTAGNFVNRLPHFPLTRGISSTGVDVSTSLASNYNYVNSTHIDILSRCFAFQKGAIRYRVFHESNPGANHPVQLSRWSGHRSAGTNYVFGVAALPTPPKALNFWSMDERSGNAVTKPAGLAGSHQGFMSQGNLVIESPYVSRYKMSSARWLNWASTNCPIAADVGGILIHGTNGAQTTISIAAGEDYTCFFWLGMPKLYLVNTTPA